MSVGDNVFTARLEGGELTAELGEAADTDLRLETDMDTFFGLASGDLPPADAVAQGLAEIEGDLSALERCFAIFSFAPRHALAPVA